MDPNDDLYHWDKTKARRHVAGELLLGKGGVLYGITQTAGKTTTCCGPSSH